jgi:hypothetical protein
MQSEEQIGRFELPWSQCRSRQGVSHENDHAQAKSNEEADSGRTLDLLFRTTGKDGGIVRTASEEAGEPDQRSDRARKRVGEDSAERKTEHSSLS